VSQQTNFRSVPSLLDWSNEAFGTVFDGLEAPYQADYVSFEAGRSPVQPERPTVQELQVPYVKGASSTRKIARRNADQIAALISEACTDESGDGSSLVGDTPGDFMILTRNTTRLDEFAEALAEKGLPYTLAGGDDVQASTELYALVGLLTCIERPQDSVARIAYLRGPLVGLSDDALYRVRASGGSFDGDFRLPSSVADGLSPDLKGRIRTAYSNLRSSRERLENLRPSAALEQIVDELGLMARTRHDSGMGSLHAGRLLRVLTDVQRLDADGYTWSEIRDELQQILDGDRSLDGLTLETGAEDAVRLLNVHKAKGLEAPVVFLADPYGGTHPKDPDEHVRRDEGEVVLPVYEQHRYNRTLRFSPKRWETEFQEVEARYQWAEEQRLLYVAATRAEEQIVVSRYRSPSWSEDKGYWAPLYSFVADAPSLESPTDPPQFRADTRETDFSPEAAAARRRDVSKPTYMATTVTERPDDSQRDSQIQGYGAAFGTAVHQLFEYAITRRGAIESPDQVGDVVDAVLTQLEVLNRREEVEHMLNSFLESTLWDTLQNADRVHTEYPIAHVANRDHPILTDGTIDLLYRTNDGWHLIDFKTARASGLDRAAALDHYRPQLEAYAEAWERATGNRLVDTALWFAESGQRVLVSFDAETK
jgi:ATP-dependent helicase/nuclease subunit A